MSWLFSNGLKVTVIFLLSCSSTYIVASGSLILPVVPRSSTHTFRPHFPRARQPLRSAVLLLSCFAVISLPADYARSPSLALLILICGRKPATSTDTGLESLISISIYVLKLCKSKKSI